MVAFITYNIPYSGLSLKCKISAICLVDTACISIAYLCYFYLLQCKYQWNATRKKAKRDMKKTFEFTLLQPKTYMCEYRVNQHSITLNLYSVPTIDILVTDFMTAKVSLDLNFM